jgi:glycosyltransferase involved in cell wall biosynthesis
MYRIAILSSPIISVPPPKYGGTERVIHELIYRLDAMDYDVTLLAPADSEVPCKLIPICQKSMPFLKNREEDSELVPKRKAAEDFSIQYIKEHLSDFDIVHSHGVDVSELHDLIPCVTTIHNAINQLNREFYEEKKDQYWISISDSQRQGFPSLNYIDTVYNGLNTRDFPIQTEPQNYMAFLARLDAEKSPHEAIQLATTLYEKYGMMLKIAGKVDYAGADYFKQEVEPFLNNPLYPYIEYLGELGMEDKIELVSNAKIFLHPIQFPEPFGLGPWEAMACGTPVIARKLGSMNELIIQGETGFIVENFVNESYHLIDDCIALDRFEIARSTRTRFNSDKMALDYVSSYTKVIKLFKAQHGL